MDNFIEAKKNKADLLKKQLNYSYNEHGERNDLAYVQERLKNVLENTTRKKEISLKEEKEKVNVLMDIKKQELTIDKFNFLDEDDVSVTCLSVII